MSRDRETLIDMARACQLILQFTRDMSKAEFLEDEKTQSSVLYQIIILGETINRLSEEFKRQNPQIPYDKIRGMRNRVTHEYQEVDLAIVWEVIQQNIPLLIELIASFQ